MHILVICKYHEDPTKLKELSWSQAFPIVSLCHAFEGIVDIQSKLDGSNTDVSFTMANSNSFLSPYEILPIAQENKYFMIFSYFIVKLYFVCTH